MQMTAAQPAASQYPDRDRNAEGRAENARPRDRYGAPLPRDAADELAHRREPEEVVDNVADAFEEAVALFNEQRFFESHEFLEYIWKSDEIPEADRDFWKGVTQVAVGCVHTQRGNNKGAVTLLERAARYMAPYGSPYQGVAADALAGAALRLASQVRDHGASEQRRFFEFPRA
ncbi:MAG: DUF309 domain-containing protein [Nitriliruptorales bacterium]|nr:DUF309 domain-containing protein [Nitriliruptorales bacterium]